MNFTLIFFLFNEKSSLHSVEMKEYKIKGPWAYKETVHTKGAKPLTERAPLPRNKTWSVITKIFVNRCPNSDIKPPKEPNLFT